MAPLTEDLGPSPTIAKPDKNNTSSTTANNTTTTTSAAAAANNNTAVKSRHSKSDAAHAGSPRTHTKSNAQAPPPPPPIATNPANTTGNDQAPRYGRRAVQANGDGTEANSTTAGAAVGSTAFINVSTTAASGGYGSALRSSRKNSNVNEDGAAVPLPNATRTGPDAAGLGTGWFDISKERPKDKELGAVPTVSDDVDERTQLEQQKRAKEAKEKLAQAVSDAAVGYQTAMPTLPDLDITNNWDRLLQVIHSEFDMSCLTTCLVRELDEDAAWNPDMLLVQLTSDMLDAAERKQETGFAAGTNGAADDAIGTMRGGEVPTGRRRREKSATSPTANNNTNTSSKTGGEAGEGGGKAGGAKNGAMVAAGSPRKKATPTGNAGEAAKTKAEAAKKSNAVPLTSMMIATASPMRGGKGGKGEPSRERPSEAKK